MALEGELSGLEGATCSCGAQLELTVQHSPAGYYLGYYCRICGPWSRETGYFATNTVATTELAKAQAGMTPSKLRTTEFAPELPWKGLD